MKGSAKMDRRIRKWQIVGSIITIVLGTLLHFVYEWSMENRLVGIIGAVNESTWEHLKLLFWPMIIFSICEFSIVGKKWVSYSYAKAVSVLFGMFFIISMFYTYKGALGKEWLLVDISIFVVGVLLSFVINYRILIKKKSENKLISVLSMIVLIILVAVFAVFTFYPPRIPLFVNPQTGTYGVPFALINTGYI